MSNDRQGFIGGSDVAAILGVSPWKSPFLLYQEKIGEYREESLPRNSMFAAREGNHRGRLKA